MWVLAFVGAGLLGLKILLGVVGFNASAHALPAKYELNIGDSVSEATGVIAGIQRGVHGALWLVTRGVESLSSVPPSPVTILPYLLWPIGPLFASAITVGLIAGGAG
jgi:hypothetical protein